MSKFFILLCSTIFLVSACTPKTTESIPIPASTTVVVPPPAEPLSPCPNWLQLPNMDEVETNYVLYHDFLKRNQVDEAYALWKKVYDVAPAADGRRNSVYADGIWFNETFMAKEPDSIKRHEYIERIFKLYDEVEQCYPEGGYIEARKAFDYYYKYPYLKTPDEIFMMFKNTIDKSGDKTPYFVINPFTALLVDRYFAEKETVANAKKYETFIRRRLALGLSECKGAECESWKIIEEYAPVRLEGFEAVEGFYDCAYYSEKQYPVFKEAADNCDVIREVYSSFVWGKCPESDAKFAEVKAAYEANCQVSSAPTCFDLLRDAKYKDAIGCMEEEIKNAKDNKTKGSYQMTIARIYYAHFKNYSAARRWALEAARNRPNWGDPYMLIGTLYASSGPLCGPGRGWDSQIVVWPAIDMWQKAKSVDSSVSGEATRMINRYWQYMPKKEDIFLRSLSAGSSFRVGCWIQETTTIRTAD